MITKHQIIAESILAIEQHSKGYRKYHCPACDSWLDNHVRHAENCTYIHAMVVRDLIRAKE